MVPVKPGDRVKTDRRDAMKLARSYRAGDLTPVWVPDAAHEALRDLVRAREAAKKDQLRARHRLGKFLLRHGRRPPTPMNSWTQTHLTWVKNGALCAGRRRRLRCWTTCTRSSTWPIASSGSSARLTKRCKMAPARMRVVIEALQALRGIAQVSAVTIVAEVGALSRFPKPRQLMGYSGAVASEDSTRRTDSTRRHHQNWQRAPPAGGHRGGVGLSVSPSRRRHAPKAPGRRSVRR